MKKWTELLAKFSSPIERVEKYMKINGLYDEEHTKNLRKKAKMAVRDSLKAASLLPQPEIEELFRDVYKDLPDHISE